MVAKPVKKITQQRMKRFLAIVLLLCFVGVTTAEAQRHFVPRYKRQKVEKDYTLDKPENKLTVSIGASANFALGMQNRINFTDYKQVTKYNEKPSLMGGNVLLGVGYKVTPNFTAGVEGGLLFQSNGKAIPLYGAFKYYFGEQVRRKPMRWFTYLNLGPQFYTKKGSKTVGATAGVGGGMRLCIAEALRCDLYVGYLGNMRRVEPSQQGVYDVPSNNVHFKQYTHSVVIGLNIFVW